MAPGSKRAYEEVLTTARKNVQLTEIGVESLKIRPSVAGGFLFSPARKVPRGPSSLWIQCPTTAAKKIMEKGRLTVGWVAARVEALATRPLLCFRCLERGHTIGNCTSEVDRSNRCYNCGSTNHRASTCLAPARCPVCADLGRPADHRLGSKACTPPIPKKRVGVPEGIKEGAQDHLAVSQGDPLPQQPGEETTQQPPSQNECGHEEAMEVTV